MAWIETWFEQDLKRPVRVHRMDGVLFNRDNLGNLIGVNVTDNGSPFTLTGGINGYCVLADGSTVPVVGSRSENRAQITLPQTAYSIPGPITITIKNTDGERVTTLCAVVGLVTQSRTENTAVPESVIEDWTQQIATALNAVQQAADNVGAIVAAPFSTSVSYDAGSYATRNGNLYRFTADHPAGAWNAAHVTQVKLGDDVRAIREDVRELNKIGLYVDSEGYTCQRLWNE